MGILVDDATVEIENIHTQYAKTESISLAVRLANAQTAVPRLLAMLCVLALEEHGEIAGTASSLMGTLHFVAAAFAMIWRPVCVEPVKDTTSTRGSVTSISPATQPSKPAPMAAASRPSSRALTSPRGRGGRPT